MCDSTQRATTPARCTTTTNAAATCNATISPVSRALLHACTHARTLGLSKRAEEIQRRTACNHRVYSHTLARSVKSFVLRKRVICLAIRGITRLLSCYPRVSDLREYSAQRASQTLSLISYTKMSYLIGTIHHSITMISEMSPYVFVNYLSPFSNIASALCFAAGK